MFKGTKVLSILLLTGLFAAPTWAQEATPQVQPPLAPAEKFDVKDAESIDAVIKTLYGVISGPKGPRNWDRFLGLMLPEARLVVTGETMPGRYRPVTPQGYVERSTEIFKDMNFWETEIHRKTERYGNIAHVFSTYESRFTSPDSAEPDMRGINSIQLYNDGVRWWIVSIYWQSESDRHPIPEKYLSD